VIYSEDLKIILLRNVLNTFDSKHTDVGRFYDHLLRIVPYDIQLKEYAVAVAA
jgi:hypothetical protein